MNIITIQMPLMVYSKKFAIYLHLYWFRKEKLFENISKEDVTRVFKGSFKERKKGAKSYMPNISKILLCQFYANMREAMGCRIYFREISSEK
jgi:hypothetical protein